jgi:hypothetical protein
MTEAHHRQAPVIVAPQGADLHWHAARLVELGAVPVAAGEVYRKLLRRALTSRGDYPRCRRFRQKSPKELDRRGNAHHKSGTQARKCSDSSAHCHQRRSDDFPGTPFGLQFTAFGCSRASPLTDGAVSKRSLHRLRYGKVAVVTHGYAPSSATLGVAVVKSFPLHGIGPPF